MPTMTGVSSRQAERGTGTEKTRQIIYKHISTLDRILPVIVHAPEAREHVSEAGVAVKFGLTLSAFYRALQPATQEALTERGSHCMFLREDANH